MPNVGDVVSFSFFSLSDCFNCFVVVLRDLSIFEAAAAFLISSCFL